MIGQDAATARLRGLADVVRDAERSQTERAGRFQRIAGRAENGSAPVAVSSFQLFPTPAAVAERMAEAAQLAPGLRVLEPSAGTGNLVRAILARGIGAADVVACELAEAVAREFSADFPAVRLVVGDFLGETSATLGGPFDRVIMNPPFRRGLDARHLLHAAKMLAPGGLLVGLCYDGRAFRDEVIPRCASWERLPEGSFRESGTRAGVVMVTIRNEATS
jgi:phospholipid N-methyltransferase